MNVTKYTASGQEFNPQAVDGYKSYQRSVRAGARVVRGTEPSIQTSREKMIGIGRSFYNDNCIFKGIVDKGVSYVIGDGFNLRSMTKNPEIAQLIEKRWRKYWTNPEIKGLLSGVELERMVMREVFITGDSGTILTSSGKIQAIEGEQIANSSGTTGVNTDSFGVVKSYSVAPYNKFGQVSKKDAKPIDKNLFCYVGRLTRPSSVRCLSPLQSSFPMLFRIEDVCDSETISWSLLSRMALAILTETPLDEGSVGAYVDDADSDYDGSTPKMAAETQTYMPDATIINLKPNEDIKSVDRNIPGKHFPDSINTFIRIVGMPLGMPIELSLNDWSKSNYSQSKATLKQAHLTFKMWQDLISNGLHTPIFEWWLANEIANGDIPMRKDIFSHSFETPACPWLDELKEAEAESFKLERGLATLDQSLLSQNTDPEDHLVQLNKEIKRAYLMADKLSKELSEETDSEVIIPPNRFMGLREDPAYTEDDIEIEEPSKETANA